MSMKRFVLSLFVASAGVGPLACSTQQRVQAETAAAKALVSDQQEEQLGRQVRMELEQQGTRFVTDPMVVSYVQGVTNRIIPFAQRDRPGVQWKVSVVDDPKTVNAFATPGGYLYVFSGLLLDASNEAELAGVMAHEAGHVVGRHSARQMVHAFGLQTVASLALGQNPSLLKQIAANLAATGVLRAHSRSEEIEADEYGVRYAAQAGYDPRGLATFFQKLKAQEGKVPGVLAWLSTHPATDDRIERINRMIAQMGVRGGEIGAERLAPIKSRLQQVSKK